MKIETNKNLREDAEISAYRVDVVVVYDAWLARAAIGAGCGGIPGHHAVFPGDDDVVGAGALVDGAAVGSRVRGQTHGQGRQQGQRRR